MSQDFDLSPIYVEARRVLLDALIALAPHSRAVIVVGAQAVYLRTGRAGVALPVAPYTSDGDLVLDPSLLGGDPKLEAVMRQAGFQLSEIDGRGVQPGNWFATARIGDAAVEVPLDLFVPTAANPGVGGRGARLPDHGTRAARRAVGLEAVLIDNDEIPVHALDPSDTRTVTVKVAGFAALLVAKAHKINDRVSAGKDSRLSDKDAADIYRIMQTVSPAALVDTFTILTRDPIAGKVTAEARDYLTALFGRPTGRGVRMAQSALEIAVDEQEVAALCTAFVRALNAGLSD